jgi:hypothetical protein
VVNIAGALAIGFTAGFAAHRLTVPLWIQEALTVVAGVTAVSVGLRLARLT